MAFLYSFLTLLSLTGLVLSEPSLWQQHFIQSSTFSSIDFASEFIEWQIYFNKTYENSSEKSNAFKIWKSNWKMVNEWNSNTQHCYTLKMNQFSDLTSAQFKSKYLLKQPFQAPVANKKNIIINDGDLPNSIDWSNITGPAQNEGQSDHEDVSIAVSISLAGFYTVSTGKLSSKLSEKELIDCVKPTITPDNCWEFIVKNNGLCSSSTYPPTGNQCEADKCNSIDPITSYIDVNAIGNSTALQYALLGGPIVIGVEADQAAFQMYSSGILNKGCGDQIDHYMVVVGYGEENGNKYWKCQNSWGQSWGQRGFILLCRDCNQNNDNGICGILKQPSFPVLP